MVNYYDHYNIPNLPSQYNQSPAYSTAIGLPTATKTAILNTSDVLWTVNFYNNKGLLVKNFQQHYKDGTASTGNYDETINSYSFTNQVLSSVRKHFVNSVQQLKLTTEFDYDHAGRLINTWETLNDNGTRVLLAQNTYNELGQLITKKRYSENNGSSFLYGPETYTYNERGWLNTKSSSLYTQNLKYNSSLQSGTVPQYNGTIAEQAYQAGFGSQRVVYKYDNLGRLSEGVSTEGYTEKELNYDKAGNILSINRVGAGSLAYAYKNNNLSNQLDNVSGFKNGSFTFDANGNTNNDGTRGISINYNFLNLPQSISGNKNIAYTYDASGRKLRTVVTNPGSSITTDYVNGLQYTNGQLDFILTSEGKINWNGGNPIYEYFLTDHLGNTTVSFDVYNASPRKLQEVNYYPMGYAVQRQQGNNSYLYNGKELQADLGVYDYGARLYDPVLARWNGIDALAEKYAGSSPYNYANNNPIYFIDPDGNEPNAYTQSQIGYAYKQQFQQTAALSGQFGPYAQLGASIGLMNKQYAHDLQKGFSNALIATYGGQYNNSGTADEHPMLRRVGDAIGRAALALTPLGAVKGAVEAAYYGDWKTAAWNTASLFATAAAIRIGGIGAGVEAGEAEGRAVLYRNFGIDEYHSFVRNGYQFEISPNYFQGKQFWVGESGIKFWTNSGFQKEMTVQLSVPKSYATLGHKSYIFLEKDMIIDGHPGGTVLPHRLPTFNSVMQTNWFSYK